MELEALLCRPWAGALHCRTVRAGNLWGGLGPDLDPELSLGQWERPQNTLWAPTSAVLSSRRLLLGARGALSPVRALSVLQGSPWC